MAPMALDDTCSAKRTSTVAELNIPNAKRLKHGHGHHHIARWNPTASKNLESPVHNQDAMQFLLTRSIGLALDAVGFAGASPIAIESFRAEVEEYITHFLADIRQSMFSSRRMQAIPQDFLQALHMNQLSLRSLIPHLDPPVPPSRSQFSLEADTKDEQSHTLVSDRIMDDPPMEPSNPYIPKNFPKLPSKHSYKATVEFSEREKDPRKIRELAMEEGRMAEVALRRLIGAASNQFPTTQIKAGQVKKSVRVMRDELWKETMLAMDPELKSQPGFGNTNQDPREPRHEQSLDAPVLGKIHLSSAVNSDRRFWRKAITTSRQKPSQTNRTT